MHISGKYSKRRAPRSHRRRYSEPRAPPRIDLKPPLDSLLRAAVVNTALALKMEKRLHEPIADAAIVAGANELRRAVHHRRRPPPRTSIGSR